MKEEWRDITGYKGRYQVSNLGNFISITKRSGRKIIKGSLDHKGYIKITLYKNGQRTTLGAHRIVAQEFIPNPKGKQQVNHRDGDKQNNATYNLEWCTNAENQQHKFHVLGYRMPAEQLRTIQQKGLEIAHKKSKKQIQCIETGKVYESIKDAVKEFGTSQSNFSLVLKGKNKTAAGYHWRYVDGD